MLEMIIYAANRKPQVSTRKTETSYNSILELDNEEAPEIDLAEPFLEIP